MKLHPDLRDFLSALVDEKAEYLVIGGYAVAYHARPRFTKDLDVWVGDDATNKERVARALDRFGAGKVIVDTFRAAKADEIVWLGAPPVRLDLLQVIPGIDFPSAFERKIEASWNGVRVWIISLQDLVAAKRATGRPQDLLDVEALERAQLIKTRSAT